MTNLAPMMSSDRPDWNTPPEVLDRVRRIAPIGLDPCGNEGSIVGARVTLSLDDDGLAADWCNAGLVFVNCPYGRTIGHWTAKCVQEAALGATVVALLPARTDARWWQTTVPHAMRVCFWRGRLRFLGAPASAPFPSAVVMWSRTRIDDESFGDAFGDAGWMVTP